MALLVGSGHSLGGIQGGNAVARLLVVVSGNTSQLTTAMAAASGSLVNFNKNASALGGAMTRSVTLPLLGIGAASLGMAAQFESAMARVRGLTPLSLGQVAEAEERILELGKELPTPPRELADSLYFAGSAGLSFSNAMQVVELSAKGAAIGMGEASDISKVLIFALNTYADEGLTAAAAMDALTAAIKEGTAEPEDMAVALGRLLPVADAAGIAFGEVTAAVATMTNLGLPTRVATTSLRALFTELLAPTERAKANLDELGLSATRLRDAVAAGPVVALELLQEATGGNIDRLKAIAPQIRGLTALLGLSDNQMKAYKRTLDATKNSTGALDKAFEEIRKTRLFQFQTALNQLRVAAIEFGRTLFPVFEGVIALVSSVGRNFSNLPNSMKTVAAAMLVLTASAGPLIRIWGALNDNGAGLFTTFRSVTTGLAIMSAAALVAASGLSGLLSGSLTVGNQLSTLIGVTIAAGLAIKGLASAANAGLLGVTRFSVGLVSLGGGTIFGIAAGLGVLTTLIGSIAGQSEAAARATREWRDAMANAATSATSWRQFLESMDSPVRVDILKGIIEDLNLLDVSVASTLPQVKAEILGTIRDIESEMRASGGFDTGFISQDKEHNRAIAGMVGQLGAYRDALKDVEAAQKSAEARNEAALLLHKTEQNALESIGRQYGITAEDVKSAASEMVVDVTNMTESQKREFAGMAGWIDDRTGEIVGNLNKMREAERELIASRQEDLAGTAIGDLFSEEVDKVEASTSRLIEFSTRTANTFSQMAVDVQSLLRRGLDPSVLQLLVDQGPAMVAKFVNASDSELRKLTKNYQVVLGATDAAILNEGKHQEVKGRAIVSNFAQAMLSNKRLPPQAALSIVGQVTNAFAQGKIKPAALKIVTDFANRLSAVKGIPRAKAAEITQAVVDGIMKKGIQNAGSEKISEFAEGIAKASGLPEKKAAVIATAVRASLNISGETGPLGAAAGSAFHQQLAGQVGAAYNAGFAVGRAAANGMRAGLRDSPKYFSYYAGQDVVNQFEEGLRSAGGSLPRSLKVGALNGLGGGIVVNVPIDARGAVITRENQYRELANRIGLHVADTIRKRQSRSTRSLTGDPA